MKILGAMAWLIPVMGFAGPILFKAPVELTDSVKFFAPVWIDADGDGIEDLVDYSEEHKKLVACCRAGGAVRPVRKIIEDPEGRSGVSLVLADLDGDGKKELLTHEGNNILWWKSIPGTGLVCMGTWMEVPGRHILVGAEDMDTDGVIDVLLYVQGEPPFGEEVSDGDQGSPGIAKIGYRGAEGSVEEWLEITSSRWNIAGLQDPLDIDGDGDLDWCVSWEHVGILEGRSLDRIQECPGEMIFGNLDPQPGAEAVRVEKFFHSNPSGRALEVVRLNGTSWETVATIPFGEEWNEWMERGYTFGFGPFDDNAEDDLIVILNNPGYVLSYQWGSGGLEQESSVSLGINLEKSDLLFGAASAGETRQPLMAGILTGHTQDEYGNVYQPGFWRWKRIGINWDTQQAEVSDASTVHDPADLTVMRNGNVNSLASIGGREGEIETWLAGWPFSVRQQLKKETGRAEAIVSGRFGQTSNVELAWVNRDREWSFRNSTNPAYSWLHAGRPDFSQSPSIQDLRMIEQRGTMPMILLGAGDFDGNGVDDLLYARPSDGVIVWKSGSRPQMPPWFDEIEHVVGYQPLIFSANSAWPATKVNISVADLDGDGDPDIVQLPSIHGAIPAVYTNDGDGVFGVRRLGDAVEGKVVGVVSGNFDGAGQRDVAIVSNHGNSIRVEVRKTDGSNLPDRYEFAGNARCMVAADFDGDGLDDLALAGVLDASTYPMESRLWILPRRSASSFGSPVVIEKNGPPASSLVAADFGGDGLVDLVAGSLTGASIRIFEGSHLSEEGPSFVQWTQEHQIAGADEDPDGDGLSNFHEYLLSTDPNQWEAEGKPSIIFEESPRYGKMLRASHRVPLNLPVGEIGVILEKSADLVNWTGVDQVPEISLRPEAPEWQSLDWNLKLGYEYPGERVFYRFRVEVD